MHGGVRRRDAHCPTPCHRLASGFLIRFCELSILSTRWRVSPCKKSGAVTSGDLPTTAG
jgi:hypothetical protein